MIFFFYFKLWQSFCLMEQNHLSNFGRGHYREHSSEMILKLDQTGSGSGDIV